MVDEISRILEASLVLMSNMNNCKKHEIRPISLHLNVPAILGVSHKETFHNSYFIHIFSLRNYSDQ